MGFGFFSHFVDDVLDGRALNGLSIVLLFGHILALAWLVWRRSLRPALVLTLLLSLTILAYRASWYGDFLDRGQPIPDYELYDSWMLAFEGVEAASALAAALALAGVRGLAALAMVGFALNAAFVGFWAWFDYVFEMTRLF